jgi:hypothetical protein
MRDANRIRLDRIVRRYRTTTESPSERDASELAFIAAFVCARAAVLDPVYRDAATHLGRMGFPADIEHRVVDGLPDTSLVVYPTPARRTAVRIAVARRLDGAPGLDLFASIEVGGKPVDVERFDACAELTPEVVERILVDGLEHIFACCWAASVG